MKYLDDGNLPSYQKNFRRRPSRKDRGDARNIEQRRPQTGNLIPKTNNHPKSAENYIVRNNLQRIDAEIATEVWGIASAIDIYNCQPEKIRDAELIRLFVIELCDLIEMRRFGETQVVHFGEDEKVAGYSMVQLIETSLISAHFANLTNTTYLDVFSCKAYDPEIVRNFAQRFFGGSHSTLQVNQRY